MCLHIHASLSIKSPTSAIAQVGNVCILLLLLTTVTPEHGIYLFIQETQLDFQEN